MKTTKTNGAKRRNFLVITLILVIGFSFAACDEQSNSVENLSGSSAQTVNETPVADDFNISGLSHIYDGSPKTVTISPKHGKSTGLITIYYNGEETAPSDLGFYPVTFNVAAATGWNAANGLIAGTLEISNQIANPQTPIADDFDIGNLSQAVGSVTDVTITPKQGKSEGQITIYYNGNTANL